MNEKKILTMATEQDLVVANDYAKANGLLEGPCKLGERVHLYTPTFIVSGLVGRVGPNAYELLDPHIVFETGEYDEASAGKEKKKEAWPGPVIRVPLCSILFACVMPNDTPEEDLKRAEEHAMKHGELKGPCIVGERAHIYTPTFIVTGLVACTGPTSVELLEPAVVFETGEYGEAAAGREKKKEFWPGPAVRVPLCSILFSCVMPTK